MLNRSNAKFRVELSNFKNTEVNHKIEVGLCNKGMKWRIKMENLSKEIGGNIRKFRTLHQMTREQLAEALNLDTAYLGQCERGERQLGLNKTIEVIRFFSITPNDIIPAGVEWKNVHKAKYLEEIERLLEGCSDNQLFAVLRCITLLLPFLRQ